MKILMLPTSRDQLGDTGRRTGFWLEEFARPYHTFQDAGAEIVLASPKGGQPPIDPMSTGKDHQTEFTRRFDADAAAKAQLAATLRLDSVSQADFDTVFYPGGHGPLWDLAEDEHSIDLLQSFLEAGKPLVEGRRGTGFANTEEAAVKLTDVVPFLVEGELLSQGATYSKGDDMAPYVVGDSVLITGQNPAPSTPAAAFLVKQLAAGAGL